MYRKLSNGQYKAMKLIHINFFHTTFFFNNIFSYLKHILKLISLIHVLLGL